MVNKVLHKVQCIKYNSTLKLSICNYSKQTLPTPNAAKTQPCETYSNQTAPPKVESITCDMIGPPHPISNLRPVIRYKFPNETPLQKKLRELQNETQQWNQTFWENHNTNFVKERDAYIEKHSDNDKKLTADEMSGFYKEFLDKNWRTHVNYNNEWYKKNFRILFLSIRVNMEAFFSRS